MSKLIYCVISFLVILTHNSNAKNIGKRIYYIKDHLGSTRLVIDPSKSGTARIIETKSYYPFGKEMPGKGGLASGEPTTEAFTGKELDTDGADDDLQVKGLQLSYFGARYYDAEIVRWNGMDPKGQFVSPFVYAGNGYNPINTRDFDGKDLYVLNDQFGGPAGFGHNAALVGNSETGFFYFSKDGKASMGADNVMLKFNSVEEFMESDAAARYNRIAKLPATMEQDIKMISKGMDIIDNTYNVLSENCADAVGDIMEAGGRERPSGSVGDLGIDLPNTQYNNSVSQNDDAQVLGD